MPTAAWPTRGGEGLMGAVAHAEPTHDSYGLSAQVLRPWVMDQVHTHAELELNLLRTGWMTYDLNGRRHTVRPDVATIFWAGVPHRLSAVGAGTEFVHVTVPLAWFRSLGLPPTLWEALLGGCIVATAGASVESVAVDRLLFDRWTRDLAPGAPAPARHIAFLEIEARLRRLALESAPEPTAGLPPTGAVGRQVEAMLLVAAERFAEDGLDAGAIAAAVGLHPHYAMTIFRRACGITLWDYVTRLRVSHAQRLLLTTDWTADAVGFRSGFGSTNAFYRAFRRHSGTTPRAFRTEG